MNRTYAIGLLGICATLALTACVPPPEPPPPALPAAAPLALPSDCAQPASRPSTEVLGIDPARSEIRIYVYREGRLAHLGHNHLVSVREIGGYVEVTKPFNQSRLALCIPVAALIVDAAELRAAAGADFATQPSASDIAGTRRNMLSETQLNGANFPYLIVTGAVNDKRPPDLSLDLRFTVRDRTYSLPVTVRLKRLHNGLTAQGTLSLKLTDLDIEPFTALFGALRVRDRLEVQFELAALMVD